MATRDKTKTDEIMKMDLYKLLDVPVDANTKQIKKAYRIKALKCHPDKNPDNPKAADVFHQLSEALQILSDLGSRAAYDHLWKARKAAQERIDKLDSKRKKVKLDLEAREKAADESQKKQAKMNLKQEIERLREEGSRILEEEQRILRKKLEEEKRVAAENLSMSSVLEPGRLKVTWKCGNDDNNGGYTHDILTKMFSKYGNVNALIVSSKKKGTAIVEFEDNCVAALAKSTELGLPSNPIRTKWISGEPQAPASGGRNSDMRPPAGGVGSLFAAAATARAQTVTVTSSTRNDDEDFELRVLSKLKKAQQEKKAQQAAAKADAT